VNPRVQAIIEDVSAEAVVQRMLDVNRWNATSEIAEVLAPDNGLREAMKTARAMVCEACAISNPQLTRCKYVASLFAATDNSGIATLPQALCAEAGKLIERGGDTERIVDYITRSVTPAVRDLRVEFDPSYVPPDEVEHDYCEHDTCPKCGESVLHERGEG